jgi:hypothetical protein
LIVCLVVFNATFNNIFVAVSFIGEGNENPEKTTDLSQGTDNLYEPAVF